MKPINDLLFNAEYQACVSWIRTARENQITWNEIEFARQSNEEGLEKFLKQKSDTDWWTITKDEWYLLVKKMKEIEEQGKPGFIGDPKKMVVSVPTDRGSCWVKYKEKLMGPNSTFTYASIQNIEKSAQKIVSQLEIATNQNNPVRGMVVGNVQSGKTANMAGVIAMAADYGYNFFIVLTGTIENLRRQTRERLISDLEYPNCNLDFRALDNLSGKTSYPDKLQDLYLGDSSNKRYLTVCLKNSSRLKDLLSWLSTSPQAKEKLKVVLIDDEADQAGVNTKNIDKKEQTAISRLIKNLVFGRNRNDGVSTPYGCMNYIGYTATPYANFLNESGDDTLYPKNFISLLNTPSEYFGPQQIFGIDDVNDGLDIINTIDDEEIKIFNKNLIVDNNLPKSLEEAIYWFIITIAIARFWKLETPVSMLIHTSQKVSNHFTVSNAIESFLNTIDIKECIENLKRVYDTQTKKFTLDDFKDNMTDYNQIDLVKDYPSFEDILPQIEKLLGIKVTHIELKDEGSFSYNEGIHLCVDNCSSSSINDFVMRIVYPESNDEIMKKTPAFIIVGGATLSRGLTLKGLTTSYFLRSTRQADTLMQMGRWFGYRHKYELLPRIWLSSRTADRFKRLTQLDYDLRNELATMEIKGLSPKDYAPRLDQFPDYQLLIITSKKKMQKAVQFTCTFYNKTAQTLWFYRDKDIINFNFDLACSFINKLGPINLKQREELHNPFANINRGSHMWLNVDHNLVLDFLENIKIPDKQAAYFVDFAAFRNWYEDEIEKGNLKNWTVVVGGLAKSVNSSIELANDVKLNLVSRSCIEMSSPLSRDYSKFIELSVITQPSDRLMDIDCSSLSDFEKEQVESNQLKFIEKRNKYASKTNPLLIVYIIDKDSGKGGEEKYLEERNAKRLPLASLNLANHLVGYYLYIPYGQYDSDPNYVTVKLDYSEDDAEVDLDENEN